MRRRAARCAGLGLLVALTFSLCASPATTKKAKSRPTSTSSRTKRRISKTGTKVSRRGSRGQKAPTPERIAEIQQALAKDGSFTGTANGKWDSSTTEAVERFQDAHGLTPTGKLDALTLQKLGLGSQIAGLAAPVPSLGSSSVTAPRPADRNE